MHTHTAVRRARVWLAALLLAMLPGCDEEELPLDEFVHEAVYEVEYRITCPGGTAGAVYATFMGEENRLVPAGRVRAPWSETTPIVSGKVARLRAWGLGGSREILLDIVVQEKTQARLRLAPGQDLKEVRFMLP